MATRGRPTLKALATELGISASAVSLALNARSGVSDELRARVLTLAAERGYQPNHAARALRIQRSQVVGLVNRNLHNSGFLAIFEGFNQVCLEHGLQVLVGASDVDPHGETSLLDAMVAHRLDGLAIAPIDLDAVLETWSPGPLVLLNSGAEARDGVHSVQADGPQAVRLALHHLIDQGHHRIALLTSSRITSLASRAATFTSIMEHQGLRPDVLTVPTVADALSLVTDQLTSDDRATAIVADSDVLAHQVYRAGHGLGLRIPQDLSVVGHDDLPTSSLLAPGLTTITMDRQAVGRAAAHLLIAQIEGAEVPETDIRVQISLVVRESTAPPAA